MIIYYFVFLIILVQSFIDILSKNKLLKVFIISLTAILMIAFSGLRWETGTDWDSYVRIFDNIDLHDLGESGYEFIYELLIRIIKYFTSDYTAVLLITAIIIISLTYLTLYTYSPYPTISILMLLSYSINSSGFGYRQDLAIAICFFAYRFIHQRKLYKFLLCILIATFVHQSALIFMIAYWIYTLKWSRNYFISLCILSLLCYLFSSQLDWIASHLSSTASYKIEEYTQSDANNDSKNLIVGILNRLFILIIPLYVIYKKSSNNTVEIMRLCNFLIIGLIIFSILGSINPVFTRFTRYFDIFHILVLPLSMFLLRLNNRLIVYMLIVLYLLLKYYLVINNAEGIYVPYKSIFNIL